MNLSWMKLISAALMASAVAGCLEASESSDESAAREAISVLPGYDLANSPANVAVGANATADFVAPAGHGNTDWVGLYPVGGQDYQLLTWAYIDTADTGVAQLAVPQTAVVGTSYELRLYLDNGYQLAARSPSFVVTGQQFSYGLDHEPSFPSPGSTVSIDWTADGAHSTTDWIGLYLTGTSNSALVTYAYVGAAGATSGTASMQLPPDAAVGATYEFRYFLNNTYNLAATSDPFTVGNALTAPAGPVPAGSTITSNWTSTTSHSATDWIGLYLVGAPNYAFATYAYVGAAGQASGSVNLVVPATAQDGEVYELRYFVNNTYVLAGRSTSFEVGASYTLAGPVGTQPPGATITGQWTAPSTHAATDWIGLSLVGSSYSSYVTYAYVGAAGQTQGATDLVIPAGTPSGSYELRYHTNNTYNKVATSDPFPIGAAPAAATLVTGIPTVANIAIDGTRVYFASGGHAPLYSDGSVQSIPIDGGTPTILVSGVPNVEGLTLDGSSVVFTSLGAGDTFVNGLVGRVPTSGGAFTTVASGLKYTMWVHNAGGNYYVANAGTPQGSFGDGSVGFVPFGGAYASFADDADVVSVVVDGGYVYWSTGGTPAAGWSDGAIRRRSVGGGAIQTLASNVLEAGSLIVVGGKVYFAKRDAVAMVDPASPGVVTEFSSQPRDPGRFATDGVNLYWTEPGGSVARKALAGGSRVVLADGISQPFGIAVDANYVYFGVRGTGADDGGIMRVAK